MFKVSTTSRRNSDSFKEKYGLPIPMPYVRDPKKKSHARKQPEGHIPRARNPFMLFRCNFVDQRIVPSFEDTDHRNISKIAGRIWQDMIEEERAPWVELAELEKLEHMRKYGTIRGGMPSGSKARREVALVDSALDTRRKQNTEDDSPGQILPAPEEHTQPAHRRSWSAPAGPPHIPQANLDTMMIISDEPLPRTMDDLVRRLSYTNYVQSSSGIYIQGDLVFQVPDSDRKLSRELGLLQQESSDNDLALDCEPRTSPSGLTSEDATDLSFDSVSSDIQMQAPTPASAVIEEHAIQSAVHADSLSFSNPFVGGGVGSILEEIPSACPLDIGELGALPVVDRQMPVASTRDVCIENIQLGRTSCGSEFIRSVLSGHCAELRRSFSELMDVDVIESRGLE